MFLGMIALRLLVYKRPIDQLKSPAHTIPHLLTSKTMHVFSLWHIVRRMETPGSIMYHAKSVPRIISHGPVFWFISAYVCLSCFKAILMPMYTYISYYYIYIPCLYICVYMYIYI
jgi:hypothetical protein